ncbi:SGNH/GDSL hydrolase family protein [Leifsonia shinshuensis]|uniref:SGNH/GDSL hydrolase family protein n=1 Tax=Leifsonia shinshuensis TaxID=150026 RepID=UPI002854D63F|nr:SGNH/GDSL hydrolase family protein [Leifsonia shinshuensis]MDR6972079.1 lysophospholipase L1-like esterase [Leifsonia shinshuensis]
MDRIGTGMGLAMAVAAAAAVLAPVPASAVAGQQSYVALGDSYAAGQEIGGSGGGAAGCLQSAQNYPRSAAARAGLQLTDVSCSGATIADLFTPANGRPAQVDALSASTAVVTLTIGGNDLGFRSVLSACIASGPQGPLLFRFKTSCRDDFVTGGVDTLAKKAAEQVAPSLGTAVSKIRAKAPNARVVVVGYPALMPDSAHIPPTGCFSPFDADGGPSVPFTAIDLNYINSVQAVLDAQSQKAVEAVGGEYVSLLANTFDHAVCGSDPYINPLQFTESGLSPSAMHPNQKGLAFEGAAVGNVLAAPRAFQGVTGALAPLGGDQYELRITVPTATLFSTPEVTAERNGSYLAHVAGEHGWYVGVRSAADSRVY